MRSGFLAVFSFILLLATGYGAGAQTPTLPCHGTQQTRMVAELLFGRNIGRSVGVSETEWTGFVAREMAPRFPDGLTITDAVGERRDPDTNSIAEEPSKHVEIVLPGNPDDQARLDAVVAAYKREFRQQSVGVIVRSACVSF
jgi:hypothetical protein